MSAKTEIQRNNHALGRPSLLKKPLVPEKASLPVRFGAALLLLAFVALMAGRFNLERLSGSLPSLDLRITLIYSLTLLFLIWAARSKPYVRPVTNLAVMAGFGLWVIWLSVSASWVTSEAKIVDELTDMVAIGAIIGFSMALANRLPAEVTSRVWKWMLVAGFIYLVLGLADGPDAQGRYSAPGGGPNVFVRVMILAAMAALYQSISKGRVWYLMVIPFFAAGAALSGSRGGVLSAGLVLMLCIVPLARRLGLKRVLTLILACASIAGIGSLFAPKIADLISEMVLERFYQQTFVEQYSSGRDGITERAIAMYHEHPGLGAGIGGYYAVYPDDGYPHNLLLSTAAEAGTVGVVILVVALVGLVLAVISKPKPLPLNAFFALAAGIYLFVTSLFSGDYYDSRLMWFFLGLAVIEAARPRPAAPTPQSKSLPRVSREQEKYLRRIQRALPEVSGER